MHCTHFWVKPKTLTVFSFGKNVNFELDFLPAETVDRNFVFIKNLNLLLSKIKLRVK